MLAKATVARWNPFKDEPIRDIAELFGVMRRIVKLIHRASKRQRTA
jgi:hypothetical protein